MSGDGSPRSERPARTLAQKLDHLFRTVHPRSRGPYSLREVAAAIVGRGGPSLSPTYLMHLRNGRRDNPTLRHLEALAEFFGVSPAYFFDDEVAARTDAQLDLLAAMRDADVRHLALRAAALPPRSVRVITEMIERARDLEGIPDDDQAAGRGAATREDPGPPEPPVPRSQPRRRETDSSGTVEPAARPEAAPDA